jgi:DNA polymerase-3 subunit delta
MMKPSELKKELGKGNLRPAYLLAGDEPLLRDDSLRLIRSAALDGSADDFNLDRLNGRGASGDQLRDMVQTLPVMAERRLVILSDPEAARGNKAKELVDAIADLVSNTRADESTVLVVLATKVDKRSAWVKAFGKDPAAFVECVAPKGAKGAVSFINAEAKVQGLSLEAGAAELLAERIGPQLLLLRMELEKVALLAGPGETLKRKHVEASTCHIAEESVWDLMDAIGDGQGPRALVQLRRMLDAGSQEPMILGALAAHFRKLAKLRSGGVVPGPPFVVKKLERQARRYTSSRLVRCLEAIHETDTALKGMGVLPKDIALERLVIGLVG